MVCDLLFLLFISTSLHPYDFSLKELNKELTRKLEAQTQRLELLMAQSMANDNSQPRHQDIRIVPESTTYADEGDEVMDH